jgi:carbon-monoxide dehydrogenase large subunit
MDAKVSENELATMKFGIGQPVPRTEDPVLLRGEGRYTDDLNRPGQAHAAMVRSPYPHGEIKGIDAEDALAMPGVLAVFTGADLREAGYGGLKCALPFTNRDGSEMNRPPRFALATDRVRFVGDPVAVVVAETQVQARDAAEAVMVDVESLPGVTTMADALKPDAPQLYDEAPGNVALDFLYGDPDAVAKAFEEAAHVTRLDITNNRIVVNPMEPRSAIGEYDAAADHWTLRVCSQGVFGLKNQLAKDILQVPPEKVRVLTGNVGGSFGMKIFCYPEYVCALHAAKMLGRPVKWTDDRSGAFLSDHHGRDHQVTAELALDKEGRFLAIRVDGMGNMGGWLGNVGPMMPTMNIVKNMVSLYRTPKMEVAVKCVFTNTVPLTAYRGAGRPEGNYYMERLIDTAAREMGIDRIELRKRNMIRPEDMPYEAPSGMTYDSGDFPALLDKALDEADVAGFEARRAASEKAGMKRGLGIGCYLEVTAPANKEMGGLRFEADGTVTIITGTLDYGQGHASAFAQVLSAKLGIPFERIRLLQGDSDEMLAGGGTGGSRSIMNSGAAILQASDAVIDKGRQIAGHVLEAAAADIEFSDGRFVIAGTDRSIHIMDLADKLRAGLALPDGVPRSLDVSEVYDGAPSAFPNGCHVCELEVDPDTGVVTIDRYLMVNDFGTIINPMLVEGQAHGGVVQGIGQALMEHAIYDEDGQLLTGSFMDYAMPVAADAPEFRVMSRPEPAKTNPLGAKGCGEAGCAGALPSVMNALVDALSSYGISHIDMPATPPKIWRAIQDAQA